MSEQRVRDESKVRPYDLFFDSLDEVLEELPADWTPIVAAQAVAESLGYRWQWCSWSREPRIEVRLGDSHRRQREKWWQFWREPWCSIHNHRNYDYVDIDPTYGDQELVHGHRKIGSGRPFIHDYVWR